MSRQLSDLGELRRFVLTLQKLTLVAVERIRELERKQRRSGGALTYTDADAVAAVEAEPTLDLTGVIPDSAYPNALLLDGSRAMTGNKLLMEPAGKSYLQWTPTEYIRHYNHLTGLANALYIKSGGGNLYLDANVVCAGQAQFNSYFLMNSTSASAPFSMKGRPQWFRHLNSVGGWTDIAAVQYVNPSYVDILQVAMSNLPTADPADGLSKLWKDASNFVKVGT